MGITKTAFSLGGIVTIGSIILYILLILIISLLGLGIFINVAWYSFFDSFLYGHEFLAHWYATIGQYVFYAAIVLILVVALVTFPQSILIAGPFLGLLYLAITGGVEILEIVFATTDHPLSTFTKNTVEGILYNIVGLGLLFGGGDS